MAGSATFAGFVGAVFATAKVKPHPPDMLPLRGLLSSNTYRLQVPFGLAPSNTESSEPYGPAGAGEGNVSPLPMFVGLKSPVTSCVLSASELAASSSNTKLMPLMPLVPPTSDKRIIFWPAGPTSKMSRSSGRGCVRPNKETLTSVTVPDMPATVMFDGNGFAAPLFGMAMLVLLKNDAK